MRSAPATEPRAVAWNGTLHRQDESQHALSSLPVEPPQPPEPPRTPSSEPDILTPAAAVALRSSLTENAATDLPDLINEAALILHADSLAADIVSRMTPIRRLPTRYPARQAIEAALANIRSANVPTQRDRLIYLTGVQVGLRMGHLMSGGTNQTKGDE